jgi:hypothetical protein
MGPDQVRFDLEVCVYLEWEKRPRHRDGVDLLDELEQREVVRLLIEGRGATDGQKVAPRHGPAHSPTQASTTRGAVFVVSRAVVPKYLAAERG